ncbi:hypothetical protein FOZ60_015475, partial [Perkinsus olseni]
MIPGDEADPVTPRSHDDQREGDPPPPVIEPPPAVPQGQARPPPGDPPVPAGNVPAPANNVPVPGPARLTLVPKLRFLYEDTSSGPREHYFSLCVIRLTWLSERRGPFEPARVALPAREDPNVFASVQSVPVYPPYLGSTKAGFTPYEIWPPESVELLDVFEGDDVGNDLDKYAVPEIAPKDVDEHVFPEFDLEKQPELASVKEVCSEFPQLFTKKLGSCDDIEHPIYTGDAKPVAQKPRRIPHCWKDDVQAQLDDLLAQGIIRHSSSPYCSPCVFAKKDGRPRICVDFRKLNEQSAPSKYPVPRPDFVQEGLHGATVFTTLDLRSGYWQIPLRKEDIHKTAFCPGANMPLFEFTRMPFGLHSATATFQSLMDRKLGHLPFVKVYLDDILIASPDLKTHLEHLRIVFRILAEANLTLNASKC